MLQLVETLSGESERARDKGRENWEEQAGLFRASAGFEWKEGLVLPVARQGRAFYKLANAV